MFLPSSESDADIVPAAGVALTNPDGSPASAEEAGKAQGDQQSAGRR